MSTLLFPAPGEYNTHNGPSTPAKEGDVDRPPRASDGKLRGRSKRSSDPSPAGDSEIEVTPDCLSGLGSVISTCGQNRSGGGRVLSTHTGENGPLCPQSSIAEEGMLDGKGENSVGHGKHC